MNESPFTVGQAAARLRVRAETIYRQINAGKIHAFKVGRHVRIPAAEIARIENTPAAGSRVS